MCSFAALNILLKERAFSLNFLLYAVIHPWEILIIKGLIFVGYIVSKYVHQNLIKCKNLVMNSFIEKCKVPINTIVFLIAVTLALLKFQTKPSYGGGRQFSSLTYNELFDSGNWYARKNEHHYQLSN